MNQEAEKQRIRLACDLLYRATRPIRILSHLGWPIAVRNHFFERKARELPEVTYPRFDSSETLALVAEARRHVDTSRIGAWLERHCKNIESSARMLAACGSADFFRYSSELYGTPMALLPDESTTSYALAKQFDKLMQSFANIDLGAPAQACHTADSVAAEMRVAVKDMFGREAPEVLVVGELSANALAGPRRIRIRRNASFTDKDISQLIHHEAYIHVATSLNGIAQTDHK